MKKCMSSIIYTICTNYIEDEFIQKGLHGIDVNMFKVFLILYADDIVVFANSSSEFQKSLDLLFDYCQRWKLVIDTSKTKIMIFRKGGRLPQGFTFYYNNILIEIVNNFSYLA